MRHSTSLGLLLLTLSSASQASAWPEIEWGGYVMVDADHFTELFREYDDEAQTEVELRRARLEAELDFSKAWQSKLKIDLSEQGEVKIKDAYLRYKGWDWASLTLGKQKEPFGLEKLTGSRNLMMIERSLVTEALAPGRNLGAQLQGKVDQFNWQLGYFVEDDETSAHALSGRLSWALKDKSDNFFHLGAAGSERRSDGTAFRINETLEVASSDSLLEGKKLTTDRITLAGLELMWQYHGLAAMAEWQQADVTDLTRGEYHYEGGYYQMSYFPSGANRAYKKGKLKGIQGSKEWEWVGRYSEFRLEQEGKATKIWSAGVNYWWCPQLTFKANVIRASYEEGGSQESDNAIAFRVQYTF